MIYMRWKEGEKNTKKIYFDKNELVNRMKVKEVSQDAFSPDNKYLSFTSDKTGSGNLNINILDLETNQILEDVLIKGWETVWLNDSKSLYYTKDDSITNRTYQLYKHTVGTEQSKDLLIYEEKDEAFSIGIEKSSSGSYIFLNSYSKDENQIWYLNTDKNDDKLVLLNKLKSKTFYYANHFSNFFYLLTNENAPNFKINRASTVKANDVVNWQEFIPENKTIYIEDYQFFENYTVIKENKKGITQFHVYDKILGDDYYIPITEETYILDFWVNRPESSSLKYSIESFSKPVTIYEWDFATRSYIKLKTMSQGNYVEDDYRAELVWAKASDGTEVPISLVYKKELFKKDGTNPLLIESYGSYGITFSPEFKTSLFPLLDRGFVYARPHIRGGGFLGVEWYNQGKLFNKKNTFTDFIECTEYLIEKGYADKEKIVARGASAGGLLMGAVANMRPELYHTMIVEVPFLDVINTMVDESIPLTTSEYKEWGNPNNKEDFEYMLSYSPYDNIWNTSYPNMLFQASYLDENAPYWEAAKTVAKIKELSKGSNLLYLKTNMEDGHQGPSGIYSAIKEEAYFQSFILKTLFPKKYK